ncbi:MAG: hypothetical protein ABI220_05535, partial [Candidatus Saccharimonadales bacterium]
MDEHILKLQNYIRQQLQSGQTPNQIAEQLSAAGWPDTDVHAGFLAVQSQIMPTPATTQSVGIGASAPQANGSRHGRIRNGWQLFKQSFGVLMGNKYLLRYMLMTGVWVFGITIIFAAIYLAFYNTIFPDNATTNAQVIAYVLAFLDYLCIYFFINIYAAGLTANVLDIFQGNRKAYHEYMHLAWSKAPAILVYSLIESVVGMILRYI